MLGFFAGTHVLTSTVGTVLMVGVMMIFAGVAQIVIAWRAPGWGTTLLWTLAGAL